MHYNTPRKIAIFVYPDVASVDISGPFDAFTLANIRSGRQLYDLYTVSVDGAPVRVMGDYLSLVPTCACADLPDRLDTLLVAGGIGYLAASEDPDILAWLRRLEPRCTRMGAVCTGSTVLAATGLTKGHRVATHWIEAVRLEAAPVVGQTAIDSDAIFLNSGKFWTSAGMLAGIDLALALIETDHNRDLALDVARFLVLPQRRSGGQSQFSSHLLAEATDDQRIRKIQQYIIENPATPLSVGLIARQAAMSERSLMRQFKNATNMTVFNYIEDVRFAYACKLLETTTQSVETVAIKSGFATAATLRRVFRRRLGVSPTSHRAGQGTIAPSP